MPKYVDLYSNINVNKKVIKLVGLETACYWALLSEIIQQVATKKTYDEKGYFTLKRDYVAAQIGLDVANQQKCEKKLVKLGVLAVDKDAPDRICMSMKDMTSLIIEEDAAVLATATKGVGKITGKTDRSVFIIASLKAKLIEQDADVRAKLEDWVESVYQGHRLTAQVVKIFEENLNSYTSDKDTKLKLIELAITFNYTNFDWVKNRYVEQMRSNVKASSLFAQTENVASSTPIATKVRKDYKF